MRHPKEAICYTQLPWNKNDLRKQRIRWTVDLSQVLWKYREMAVHRKYSFLEKLTFWYYVLFEKFSPHIEFISLITCIILSIIFGYSKIALILLSLTISFQFVLSIIGSFKSIKNAIKLSKNKFKSILKFLLLMTSFITIYHWWHSFYRLIAVPVFKRKQHKTNNHGSSWKSPTRM